jgi:hypothetical protein
MGRMMPVRNRAQAASTTRIRMPPVHRATPRAAWRPLALAGRGR